MYIVYCQNKPKSEHIVSEYIDTFFEVRPKLQTKYFFVTVDFKKLKYHLFPRTLSNPQEI